MSLDAGKDRSVSDTSNSTFANLRRAKSLDRRVTESSITVSTSAVLYRGHDQWAKNLFQGPRFSAGKRIWSLDVFPPVKTAKAKSRLTAADIEPMLLQSWPCSLFVWGVFSLYLRQPSAKMILTGECKKHQSYIWNIVEEQHSGMQKKAFIMCHSMGNDWYVL